MGNFNAPDSFSVEAKSFHSAVDLLELPRQGKAAAAAALKLNAGKVCSGNPVGEGLSTLLCSYLKLE